MNIFKRASCLQRIGVSLALIVLLCVLGYWARPVWQRAQLHRNQAQWASQHLSHYRLTLTVSCFCPSDVTQPVTIDVRDQRIQTVTAVATQKALDPKYFTRYVPIEHTFTLVSRSIDYDGNRLFVTFDPQRGYPTSIDVTGEWNVSDSSWGLSIEQFEPLPD